MARAIIRIMLPSTTDEEAVALKKKIEALVKDIPDVDVELSILAR